MTRTFSARSLPRITSATADQRDRQNRGRGAHRRLRADPRLRARRRRPHRRARRARRLGRLALPAELRLAVDLRADSRRRARRLLRSSRRRSRSRPSAATSTTRTSSRRRSATAHGTRARDRRDDALGRPGHLRRCASSCARSEGWQARVPLRWRFEPRFGYGAADDEDRAPLAALVRGRAARDALALGDLGRARAASSRTGVVDRRVALEQGRSALCVAGRAHGEPLVLPGSQRRGAPARPHRRVLAALGERDRSTSGPWRDAVVRSALVAEAARLRAVGRDRRGADDLAPRVDRRRPELGLPLHLAARRELDARRARPARLPRRGARVLLVADARVAADAARLQHALPGRRRAARAERELPGSTATAARAPVRIGNGAAQQLQLDVYGGVLEASGSTSRQVGRARPATPARRSREIADCVAALWREPDSGIWEVRSEPTHFIQSKAMCWVALDRACRLAERGRDPGPHASAGAREADAIRAFVDDAGLGRGARQLRARDRPARARREPADARAPRLRRPDERAAARHGRRGAARARKGPVRLPLPRRRRRRRATRARS